jgi:hypothetical protein
MVRVVAFKGDDKVGVIMSRFIIVIYYRKIIKFNFFSFVMK